MSKVSPLSLQSQSLLVRAAISCCCSVPQSTATAEHCPWQLHTTAAVAGGGSTHTAHHNTHAAIYIYIIISHDSRVDAGKELAECSECSSQLMSVVLCGREGVWERREGAFQATRYGNVVAL